MFLQQGSSTVWGSMAWRLYGKSTLQCRARLYNTWRRIRDTARDAICSETLSSKSKCLLTSKHKVKPKPRVQSDRRKCVSYAVSHITDVQTDTSVNRMINLKHSGQQVEPIHLRNLQHARPEIVECRRTINSPLPCVQQETKHRMAMQSMLSLVRQDRKIIKHVQ